VLRDFSAESKEKAKEVKTDSEKDGYQKRGRQIYGPDYIQKKPAVSVAKDHSKEESA
jgi:hypothetical protein